MVYACLWVTVGSTVNPSHVTTKDISLLSHGKSACMCHADWSLVAHTLLSDNALTVTNVSFPKGRNISKGAY